MSSPFDNFDKMNRSLESSLRIAESFNQRALAMSNFHSAFCAVNSPAIVATANALTSAKLVATSSVLNTSRIMAATNAFSNSSAMHAAMSLSGSTFLSKALSGCTSVSQNMFESTALAQKLANQLTFPPVYSVSSTAAEISSRIINPVSGVFTPEFLNLAAEIRELPLDTFEYSFDGTDNVNISNQLEEKLSTIVDVSSAESNSHRKAISKEFFYSVILPIILALLQLGYSMHSDNQSARQLEQHHQEEMSIQRQLLNEEQQQTEYLRRIAESSVKSLPAIEDGPSSQTAEKY